MLHVCAANMVATSLMWLLSIWNMASRTEELNFQTYLILIHLNLNRLMWLVATMLGKVVLKLNRLPRKCKEIPCFPQRHRKPQGLLRWQWRGDKRDRRIKKRDKLGTFYVDDRSVNWISQIKKAHIPTGTQKEKDKKTQFKYGQKIWTDRHFMKEKIQMANKLMEKWPTSFVIREVQTEAVMRHSPSAMMVDIKITDSVKCWWGGGTTRMLIHWWWKGKRQAESYPPKMSTSWSPGPVNITLRGKRDLADV